MDNAIDALAEAVAKLGLTAYTDLSDRRKRDRVKMVARAASIIMGQPVRTTKDRHGHLVLQPGEVGGELDESEDEAVEVIYQFREMHLSVRNLYRLRRTCRRETLDRMRQQLLPYRPRLVTFQPGVGRARAGSVVDLRALVETRIELELARNNVQVTRGCVWVIICFDGTQVWKSGITRCDVFVDVYGDKGEARRPKNWSTWFIFDGPDDAGPLCIADQKGELNPMVVELEQGGVSIGDKKLDVTCLLTGDGKGMGAANPRRGCKCWWCRVAAGDFLLHLAPVDIDEAELAAIGGFLTTIRVVRRIGDLVHGALRTVNCVLKRLLGDERVGRAHGLPTAIRTVLGHIASDAAHIPSDMRLQPLLPKPGQMDITTCQVFLKQPERFAEIEEVVNTKMGVVWVGEGAGRIPFHAVVGRMLRMLAFMNRMWRAPGGLTGQEICAYEKAVRCFGVDMGLLRWKPAHWCHWVLVHSVQVAKLYRNFSIFSSIPTERRHVEFKMDIRHCFQGYKLSKVALAHRYAPHILQMDALDIGLRLWVIRKCSDPTSLKVKRGMRRFRRKV